MSKGLRAAANSLHITGTMIENHPGLANVEVEFPAWDMFDEMSGNGDPVERCVAVRSAAQAILGDENEVTKATLEELGALLQYIAVRIEAAVTPACVSCATQLGGYKA